MYRLIETYSDASIILAGVSYPNTALIEDADGIRMLLIPPTGIIRASVWVSAYSQGMAALVTFQRVFRWMTAETFMEGRKENISQGTMEAPDRWNQSSEPLTYREMLSPSIAAPKGFIHLHSHSEFSALDGLSKVSEMVAAVTADNQTGLAITDHGVCASHPHLQVETKKAGIRPIFGCLFEGQEIVTREGVKPVECIEVGDMVLTHRGRFRPVVRTMQRDYTGVIYHIKPSHGARKLTLTEEHPILVRSRNGSVEWVKPGEIETGYSGAKGVSAWQSWVCLPKLHPDQQVKEIPWSKVLPPTMAVVDGKVQKIVRSVRGETLNCWPNLPESIVLDASMARFLGLYVAEGSTAYRDDKLTGHFTFSFNFDEQSYAAGVVNFLRDRFGVIATEYVRPERGLREVGASCLPLAYLLSSWCGRGAKKKHIPSYIWSAPKGVRSAFIRGVIDGDGKRGPHCNLKTSSRGLAWSMRLLIADLGHWRAITYCRQTLNTRGRASTDGAVFDAWMLGYDPHRKWSHSVENNDYLFRPIKSVEKDWVENKTVYNFEVAEDNSYVSDFILHNCEAYFVPDASVRDPKIKSEYHHLILWALNDTGLHNLWAATTAANQRGFYYHPRMDWSILSEHSEGIMCSTACLRGPLAVPIAREQEDLMLANLGKLRAIFGDRLVIELHTNALEEQKAINKVLVNVADTHGLPYIVVSDSHYPCQEDQHVHRAWLSVQTRTELQDDSGLFGGDCDYHLMTASEVASSISYLGNDVVKKAMDNTLWVANQCNATLGARTKTPTFSKVGGPQKDVDRLLDMCLANWSKKVVGKEHPEQVYADRLERELKLLVSKGFSGYMLMVADYVRWSKDHGILVGPCRGSSGGSLVAYLADITEVDPIEHDLLFERFLTEGRTSLPDIDVDFPTSRMPEVQEYIRERWGQDSVVRVGTHIRVANKGVIRDLARALKNTIEIDYADINAVSTIIEEIEAGTAGLGMDWDEMWSQHEESLGPYRAKYPLLFGLADRLVGRLKTYGKHAAGFVISTDGEPLSKRLPLRSGEDGQPVTEFDMEALEVLGLVKADLLALRTLDTIQMTLDLIEAQTGKKIDVYAWRDEYKDPEVWDEIVHTAGIFQIETKSGTRMVKRLLPRSLADLATVITIVRPGPMRSGLTETYLRRRAGEEVVTYPDPRMEPALKNTFGAMIYQEQVMAATMVLAGYDSNEADRIRKILGKKKVELIESEGRKFVEAAVERGMVREAASNLWTQMAEFSRYGFVKSHAMGYAIQGFQCAWLKKYYPIQFLTAVMSTVEKDRIPVFVGEARRMGYKVLPPDINESGIGFKAVGNSIRYGLDAVKGVGGVAVKAIVEGQPYDSIEALLARPKVNMGVVRLLASIGAMDSLEPNRRRLESRLDWLDAGGEGICALRDDKVIGPGGLPCTFDWSSEPIVIGKSGKPLKGKPLPKKCSKACRQFVPGIFTNGHCEPYTEEEIRERELELLGVYLSSTPFDRVLWAINEGIITETILTAEQIESSDPGEYIAAAVVTKVRPHRDKHGREMGFLTLFAQDGDVDVTVFHEAWGKHREKIVPNRLAFITLRKNDRGCTLTGFQAV